MVDQRAERWSQAIVDSLSLRLGSLYAVTKTYDSTPDIYVKVALVAGGNNSVRAIVKLVPATAPACGGKDSLGLTQIVYSPHTAAIAYDITAVVFTTAIERFWVDRIVFSLGTRVEIYEKTVGASNLVVADVAVGNFVVGADNINETFGAMCNL